VTGERWSSETRERLLAQELDRCVAQARDLEERVCEHERMTKDYVHAREHMANRIDAARRDVYAANLRAEQALTDRDAILSSTIWRATRPLRLAGDRLPFGLRRAFRAGAQITWWSLTFQLPRRLRERGWL
jgi:hypothetical protein